MGDVHEPNILPRCFERVPQPNREQRVKMCLRLINDQHDAGIGAKNDRRNVQGRLLAVAHLMALILKWLTRGRGMVRSGMPLEYLRQLLGLSRIEDRLPYARLVRGSLDAQMAKLDTIFTDFVQPVEIAA
jgi:hypothetical protein